MPIKLSSTAPWTKGEPSYQAWPPQVLRRRHSLSQGQVCGHGQQKIMDPPPGKSSQALNQGCKYLQCESKENKIAATELSLTTLTQASTRRPYLLLQLTPCSLDIPLTESFAKFSLLTQRLAQSSS